MNKTTSIAIGTLVFTIGVIGWAKYSQPNYHKDMKMTDSEIVSTNGLHWHPKLEIYVNGIKRAIPNNIGMTGGEMALHTHEDTPIVHMEFQGLVRAEDITLGSFFRTWGKTSEDFGQNVTMTVNDKPNTELMDYQMRDGDAIVLKYE